MHLVTVINIVVADVAPSAGRQPRGTGRVRDQLPVLHCVGADIRCTIRLSRQDVRPLCLWLW